ncbi:unnamed protein product, partial [Mesorhabditis spiculigera]
METATFLQEEIELRTQQNNYAKELLNEMCGLIEQSLTLMEENKTDVGKLEADMVSLATDVENEGNKLRERIHWLHETISRESQLAKETLAEKEQQIDDHVEMRESAISEQELYNLERQVEDLEGRLLEIDDILTTTADIRSRLGMLKEQAQEALQRQQIIDDKPAPSSYRLSSAAGELTRVLLQAEEMLDFLTGSKEADLELEAINLLNTITPMRVRAEQNANATDGTALRFLADVECATGKVFGIRPNAPTNYGKITEQDGDSTNTSLASV